MSVRFAPATVDDVDALADLAARTFPLACPPGLPGAAIDEFIAAQLSPFAFTEYIDSADHVVLVGKSAGQPAYKPAGQHDDPATTEELLAYALLIAGPGTDPAEREAVRHRPTTYISKFYVEPAAHGSGIATEMHEAVVELCTARHDQSLWLGTNDGNLRAQRFYEKSGFEVVGRRSFFVGDIECTDLIYERPL